MAKPEKVFKTGAARGLQVSLWRNDKGLSATINKSFKAGDGWKQTNTLFPTDLAAVAALVPTVIEYMDAHRFDDEQSVGGSDAVYSAPAAKQPQQQTMPASANVNYEDDDVPF